MPVLPNYTGKEDPVSHVNKFEMVIGGCMVLTVVGSITNNDPKHISEIVGRVLNDMVSEVYIQH